MHTLTLPLFLVALLTQTPAASVKDATAFTEKLNTDLQRLSIRATIAEWIKATYITDDTEKNAAAMNEDLMAYIAQAIQDAQRFQDLKLDSTRKRMLYLLRYANALPAPAQAAKRRELAQVAAKLEGIYGKGKWCGKDKVSEAQCKTLQQLSKVLTKGGSYDAQLDAWKGWREISKPMRPLFQRLVELTAEGAREIGFRDLSHHWRGGYDMSPQAFEREVEKLWQQVKPLYDALHCYVRSRLSKHYGADKVPSRGPLPAHLLGNMWAQEWSNIYPLVEPHPGQPSLDVTKKLKAWKYDAKQLVGLGEGFFVSLGFSKLPASFWERSQFVKPAGRDVVCHASAWDVTHSKDVRIKMCIDIDEENLITVHHELGHLYYFMQYWDKPILFRAGANDGFHEAIGDALTLSITPAYLKRLKLIDRLPKDDKGLINVQLKSALEKIAFLPFGRMVDQWRWDVFSGAVKPHQYNAHWWALRKKYQGIKTPGEARGEMYFDPGAKYHVPANVSYMRYFLARILQFQFHRALCEAAGHKGPLHTCSIYGNKNAGAKLKRMLQLGASKPWPDALQVLTGQRHMDASALFDYFAPLRAFLDKQNRGRTCGW